MNSNFLLANIYIKFTGRFGLDLTQSEKTLRVEQRAGITRRHNWVFSVSEVLDVCFAATPHLLCVLCRPTWWCRRIAMSWPCRTCRRPRQSWTTSRQSWMWCRPSTNRPWRKSRWLPPGVGGTVTLHGCGNPSFLSCFLSARFGLDQGFIEFIQMQTQHIIPH